MTSGPLQIVDPGEDDDSFALRRVIQERRMIAETSCVVRSVHEELLEAYEDRAAAGANDSAALNALLDRIDAGCRGGERGLQRENDESI